MGLKKAAVTAAKAVASSKTGKVVLAVGKYGLKGNIVTFLASFVVAELIAQALENSADDPEKAVEAILQAGQRKAVVQSQMDQSQGEEVQEAVAGAFQGVRPERQLSELALQRQGAASITPDQTPVLEYISRKMNISPERFRELSNPARMGDFTQFSEAIPQHLQENVDG